MSHQKTIHLFNCDHLYDLNVVESFLNVVKNDLPFKLYTEKHYFNLQDMSSFSEEIKTMYMDYAVFVVHANESRLSINEQNAGIGYGIIFKELVKKTDGKVLVVIGGDSHYGSEEKQQVISDWARYKISSQFSPESMDGRKSFVFSWNEQYSEVHVQAMKHFFVGTGEFNYNPKMKRRAEYNSELYKYERDYRQNYGGVPDEPYQPGQSAPRHKTWSDNIKENPKYTIALVIFILIVIIIILATTL